MSIQDYLEEFKDKKLTLPALSATFLELVESEKQVENSHLQTSIPQPFAVSNVLAAKIINFATLAKADDVKTVYEINLSVAGNTHQYFPGDTIGILTKNDEEEVNYLLAELDYLPNCDKSYRIGVLGNTLKKNAKRPVFIPEEVTIRKVLSEGLDIRSIPKKLCLRSLLNFVLDPNEKRFLEILCSKEGASAYDRFIIKQGTNFITLMKSIKSCKPPLTVLLEHLPRLMPRPYSIANSPLDNKDELRIIFSLSNDEKKGLATSMLEELGKHPVEGVNFYFRQSNHFVHKEEDWDKNVIMIGAGTGVAPFIGFLEHRQQANIKTGRTCLFVGCRYENRNHLYRDKFQQYLKSGVLNELSEAFSRDDGSQFKYIQDQITDKRQTFIELLTQEDTKLYICGESKNMLPQIQDTIIKCLGDVLQISEEEAKSVVLDYKKKHKYIEDLWV